MTDMSIPTLIRLLLLDPESGKNRSTESTARIVLAGSIAELAVRGAITFDGSKILLIDPSPTGTPGPDAVLHRLRHNGPHYVRNVLTSEDFTSNPSKRPDVVALDELVSKGAVAVRKGSLLHRSRAVPIAEAVRDVVQDIDAVVAGQSPTPQLAAIVSVLYVFGVLNKVLQHPLDAQQRSTVIKVMTQTPVGNALHSALREISVS